MIDTLETDYHQLIANSASEHSKRLGRLINYIEVGVLTGNSAMAVLRTKCCFRALLIDNFSNTHCGEIKSSRDIVEQRLSDFNGKFEVREGDSRVVLLMIKERFDIGFIDGDHTAEGCQSDLDKMFPLISQDGILFVDDMRNPGYMHIEGIVTRFALEHGLEMTYHHVHEGLGELRKR